jgi:hypothetical protein
VDNEVQKEPQGENNTSLTSAPCDDDLKVYGFNCGESQTCFRFRTTPIKCMKNFILEPTTDHDLSRNFFAVYQEMGKGIAIAAGAFCFGETGRLHHPTGFHNMLPPCSIQSNDTRLHLGWYCVMKTISRAMVD